MNNRAEKKRFAHAGHERRSYMRINRPLLAKYSVHLAGDKKTNSASWDMFTINSLGPEGASFNYYKKLQIGSLADLRIAFPAISKAPIAHTGTIIRNTQKSYSSVFFSFHIATVFADIGNRKKALLVKGIEEYYRMLNKNAEITKEIKGDVWMRDRARCVKCSSKKDLEFCYIFPISKGGATVTENIHLLCQNCKKPSS